MSYRTICTGGSGYLGSVLVPRLLAAGHNVVVVDVDQPAVSHPALRFEQCDIREIEPTLFEEGDRVIHLAGLSNDATFEHAPSVSRAVNVNATLRIAELAQSAGARHLIFASSCSVYGALGDAMVDETSPVSGVSEYALAKAECERELVSILTGSTGLSCLRFGTLFGLSPRTRFDLVVNRMTLTAVQDQRVWITGGGLQWRPLLHVDDAARAIQMAVESEPPSKPNICNVVGENTTMRELGKSVAQRLGVKAVIDSVDAADPRSYRAEASRITSVLGFRPQRTVPDGIDEIHESLISSGTSAEPVLHGDTG